MKKSLILLSFFLFLWIGCSSQKVLSLEDKPSLFFVLAYGAYFQAKGMGEIDHYKQKLKNRIFQRIRLLETCLSHKIKLEQNGIQDHGLAKKGFWQNFGFEVHKLSQDHYLLLLKDPGKLLNKVQNHLVKELPKYQQHIQSLFEKEKKQVQKVRLALQGYLKDMLNNQK